MYSSAADVDQQSQPAAVDMNIRQPDSAAELELLLELVAVEATIDYQLVPQDFEIIAIVVELAIVVVVLAIVAEPVAELPLL